MKGQIRNIYPGGNTPKGFYSYYSYILPQRDAERIFCIKGGPGTGKSTLMKEIGAYFSDKGEAVDFLWCSSDPNSLDGVLLKKRGIALVDGTAPHIVDPMNPGAVDEIINLGESWNEQGLKKNRQGVISSNEKIGETFQLAYGYLKCAECQYDIMALLLRKLISPAEIQDYRRQLEMKLEGISSIRRAESKVMRSMALGTLPMLGRRKKFFASAITPDGVRSGLQSIINGVEKIILLEAPMGLSTETLLSSVSERLIHIGFDVEEYYCPMGPDHKIEHIVSQEAGLAVVTCNPYHTINEEECGNQIIRLRIELDGSAAPEHLERFRVLQEESGEMISKALQLLEKAKKLHDELEDYYVPNMDFAKIEKTKQQIIDKIEML